MAKDKDSRILLYQNHDVSVQVTQISIASSKSVLSFPPANHQYAVEFGCIPWTPEKSSTRVSFLNEHVITVIDKDGHHLYHIDPKYYFDDWGSCKRFQETLRERKHLGAFDFVELTHVRETLSRRQVLRFWRRDVTGEKPAVVTMTFLASTVGNSCGHREYDMANYDPEPTYVFTALELMRRPKESQTVQLSASLACPTGAVKIKFESIQGEPCL